jgi:hypothetical protein
MQKWRKIADIRNREARFWCGCGGKNNVKKSRSLFIFWGFGPCRLIGNHTRILLNHAFRHHHAPAVVRAEKGRFAARGGGRGLATTLGVLMRRRK